MIFFIYAHTLYSSVIVNSQLILKESSKCMQNIIVYPYNQHTYIYFYLLLSAVPTVMVPKVK